MDPSVLKLLESDTVDRYVDQKRERKDKDRFRWGLPALSAALLGGGYGMKRFGNWVISPEDALKVYDMQALETMLDRNSKGLRPEFQEGAHYFSQYLDRAGRAANVRLFGGRIPAINIIQKYREKVAPMLGDPDAITTPEQIANAKEHYRTFAAGPAQALVHYTDEFKTPIVNEISRRSPVSPAVADRALSDLKTPLDPKVFPWGLQADSVNSVLLSPELREKKMSDGRTYGEYIKNLSGRMSRSALGYINASRIGMRFGHELPNAYGSALMQIGKYGLMGSGAYLAYRLLTRKRRLEKQKRDMLKLRRQVASEFEQPKYEKKKAASLSGALGDLSAAAAYARDMSERTPGMTLKAERALNDAEIASASARRIAEQAEKHAPAFFQNLNNLSRDINQGRQAVTSSASSLRRAAGALGGGAAGYLSGDLIAGFISPEKRHEAERLRAIMRLLGMSGGAALGYHMGRMR
jgi:hypothetical protein